MNFGSYLNMLRKSKGLRQEDLASMIGVSAVYVCDIEKGRRNPPDIGKLRVWSQKMELTQCEAAYLYDLAGEVRGSIAPDILEYLNANPDAKRAIRRIIENRVPYNWNAILEKKTEEQ